MTLYSSREPFNDDPFPRVTIHTGARHRDHLPTLDDATECRYDPRPEYDRPQNNPTNPILVAAREDILTWYDSRAAYEWWAEDFDLAPETPEQRHPGHVDHARKVLTRLAALKEES